MKIWKIALGFVAFFVLVAAAPSESGYGEMPQKASALSSRDEITPIREKSVRPEEVSKYGVQEVALIATETGYLPSRIIVRNNIPVHLFVTSASPATLCFVMDEFSLRKGVENQSVTQLRFLPTKAGTYKFYCPAKEIQGTVVVRD